MALMSRDCVEEGAAGAGTGEAPGLDEAIDRAVGWLRRRQHREGYWVGRLESNSSMEAEWILALHFLGLPTHPLIPRLAKSLLREQRADGAWQVFHDAPAGDVSATVEAYAALRAAGHSPDEPALEKARGWILARGGLSKVRVFTRYWLALIGEWPWEKTPNLPPEVIRFPDWFPFSIYNFSQWARATLVPIAVLSARRPVQPLPPTARLDELFPEGRAAFDYSLPKTGANDPWRRFFLAADQVLHRLQSLNVTPLREGSIATAMEWIIKHQDADGVWGGIQPPWIYSLMALHVEGYALSHPVVAKGLAALDDPRWRVDEEDASYVQASVSPVWDTVLTLLALQDAEADEETEAEVERAVDWLLSKQVRAGGDWCVKVKGVEPGGWAFEYENLHYPDVDDTAVALIVLAKYRGRPDWAHKGLEEAIERGVAWMLAMQCSNGGWAAFDKDNDKTLLTKIPFCDFGEALDPPSVDVTAHVIEALGLLGYDQTHPAVARGLAFLRAEQEADGSWFGRWGVNYVYGAGAVLPALKAVGVDMRSDYVLKAADWLKAQQQACGGWGESCSSYMDPSMKARGLPTASQTGWAVMALAAVGRPEDRAAVERGVKFLRETQADDTWDEPTYTGTGFPGYGVGSTIRLDDPALAERLQQGPELSRAFMINYNMYRHYFPLMAMGRARRYLARRPNAEAA